MKKNIIETLVGGMVLVVACGFAFTAYRSAGLSSSKDNYQVIAKFERADGIKAGSDVRIGGVKVGAVSDASLDAKTYQAQIEMVIDNTIKLPTDSSAQIVSDGLLGGKYIALIPGADEEMLPAGGEVTFTQSSVNLETLIGKMIFSGDDDKEAPAKKAGGTKDASPLQGDKEAPLP